jgi:hypothetical protein
VIHFDAPYTMAVPYNIAITAEGKLSMSTKPRSVVPIPGSIESIKGYPEKLKIFKVPASDFYWVRYFESKTIKRSTKTSNKSEAIKFAKEFYEDIIASKRSNSPKFPFLKKPTSFQYCAEGVIKEDERGAKRNEISESYAASQKKVIRKYISEFFSSHDMNDIDYSVLDDFKDFLYDKELSPATIKIHFSSLKKVFNFAEKNKILNHTPLFPKVKREDTPRGYFKLHEYEFLCRTAKKLEGEKFDIRAKSKNGKQGKKLRNVIITDEIRYLIGFMIYTFIRPSDVKLIKHKHIHVKHEEKGLISYDYLWLPIPETKSHNKPLISMPRAAYFYRKLREMRLKNGRQINDDDYLFEPEQLNRDTAYRRLVRQFDALLEALQLKFSSEGDIRTLYSLRHTSLMYRLKYGEELSPIKLANNARTSVEMLTRFYLPQLENEDIKRELHAKKLPKNITSHISTYNLVKTHKTINLDEEVIKFHQRLPEHIGKRKVLVSEDGSLKSVP